MMDAQNRGRLDPLAPKATAPRAWPAMLDTWRTLLGSLCLVLGGPEEGGLVRHLWMWRWMWSLPPYSEARKAAFTLGHAALLIERWRIQPDVSAEDDRGPGGSFTGQRAEALLRFAAWHIVDARAEAHGRTLDIEPKIPLHERVYSRPATGDGEVFVGPPIGEQRLLLMDTAPDKLSRAILADYFWRCRLRLKIRDPKTLAERFTNTAIASLPDGPWMMTTQDVTRFLEMLLEDAA